MKSCSIRAAAIAVTAQPPRFGVVRARQTRKRREEEGGGGGRVSRTRWRCAASSEEDGVGTWDGVWMRTSSDAEAAKISKSDASFRKEGVFFDETGATFEGDDLDELNKLFAEVGFPRRAPEKLQLALENSHHVICARAVRKSRFASRKNQIVGVARTTSDGAFNAVIWDIAVLPAWQKVGIGRGLIERTVHALCQDGIDHITLFSEPNVVSLYRKLGFSDADADLGGVKGMALMHRDGFLPTTEYFNNDTKLVNDPRI